MKETKWLQKRLERESWEKFKQFLEGFKKPYLVKIVNYHNLTCADTKQQRCIYKSIRLAKLNYQDIWEALIND